MIKLCCDSGVALVLIPELTNTRIKGATEWLSPEKALIILSSRVETDEQFWFTFFHQAGHVSLHSKKQVFIDTTDDSYSENEMEANSFARNQIIDTQIYNEFIGAGRFFRQDILKFAEQNRIAPGIIVGMLQQDKLIDYSLLNDLKQRYDFRLEK
jgi:Zn-dependent peptidase ImmA (M78 family)